MVHFVAIRSEFRRLGILDIINVRYLIRLVWQRRITNKQTTTTTTTTTTTQTNKQQQTNQALKTVGDPELELQIDVFEEETHVDAQEITERFQGLEVDVDDAEEVWLLLLLLSLLSLLWYD
jgi:hypothetical protein